MININSKHKTEVGEKLHGKLYLQIMGLDSHEFCNKMTKGHNLHFWGKLSNNYF